MISLTKVLVLAGAAAAAAAVLLVVWSVTMGLRASQPLVDAAGMIAAGKPAKVPDYTPIYNHVAYYCPSGGRLVLSQSGGTGCIPAHYVSLGGDASVPFYGVAYGPGNNTWKVGDAWVVAPYVSASGVVSYYAMCAGGYTFTPEELKTPAGVLILIRCS